MIPTHKEQRIKELRILAISLVADAHFEGLSIDEAIETLKTDRGFVERIYAQRNKQLFDWAQRVKEKRNEPVS